MINVITTTEASGEVRSTEFQMSLSDGTKLFYRAWIPREPTRKALVIFHRGHEHSGRLEDVVRDLHLRNVAIFAWDAGRRYGRPGAQRGRCYGCGVGPRLCAADPRDGARDAGTSSEALCAVRVACSAADPITD